MAEPEDKFVWINTKGTPAGMLMSSVADTAIRTHSSLRSRPSTLLAKYKRPCL